MMTFHFRGLPEHPKLDTLLRQALAKVNAMSPAERKAMYEAQQRSWVIGEMLIEHPEMSRAEAERIYEETTS